MKFDASEICEGDTFLGRLCFTIFVFFVVFIGMTMFISISIISDGFRSVREKNQMSTNENVEMFEFMWNIFLRQIGNLNKLYFHLSLK